MMKNRILNASLIKTESDSFPLVRVKFFDSEDYPQAGVMIVDTGSSMNCLFGNMNGMLPAESRVEGKTVDTQAIGDKVIQTNIYDFSFWLDGQHFREEFELIDHLEVNSAYGQVIGLLGLDFLCKYGLALNFANHTLSTSLVASETLDARTCSYLFPLSIGLSTYGVPIIPIAGKEKMYSAMLDTGSPYSSFPEHIIKKAEFPCEYLDEYDEVTYVTCKERMQKAHMQFEIMGLGEDWEGPFNCYEREGKVLITKHEHFIKKEHPDSPEGEPRTTTVDVLLGNQFIAREGWTLDFANIMAYKLKDDA